MKKRILAILLAVSMVSTSVTVYAEEPVTQESTEEETVVDDVQVEEVADEAGIEALAEHNGPYEKWQIVKVGDGDKVIVDVSDTITLEMLNQNVINWTYDGNGLYLKRDDSENPHYGKEYQSHNHYWATLTLKQAGKYVVDGNAYNYSLKEYVREMSFKVIVNDSKILRMGETKQLESIMNGDITWATDNKTIAEVDSTGKVKGIGVGTAHITATDKDGDVVTFTITVESKPIIINVGDSKNFTKFLPEGEAVWGWSIDDTSIAEVDENGVVTGVRLGKTNVTATSGSGESITYTVSVTELKYFNTNIFDYKDGEQQEGSSMWMAVEGATYLDGLDLGDYSSGWGSVGTGYCGACLGDGNSDEPIGVRDKEGNTIFYEKGIALHAWDAYWNPNNTAYVKVNIPTGMKHFTAVAGINQCRKVYKDVKMQFKVTAYAADGTPVGTPFDVTIDNSASENHFAIVNMNVEGASYLLLEMFDGGNGNGSDHGVFADAKFTAEPFDQTTRVDAQYSKIKIKDGINDYTKKLNADDSQNLYFIGGNGDDYLKDYKQNKYTDSNAVVKGIAQDKLDGPNFKANYTEPGLFDTVASDVKDVFTGVKFPFAMDIDGYYTFDSGEMDAAFNDGIGQSGVQLNWYNTAADFAGVENADKDHTGFFPFNDTKGAETYNEEINYWYGMNMAVDFYMMNGGYLDDQKKEPIIFEFSGDDDVWVYVDGKLVLDLGGIHSEAQGSINFGTRKIMTTDEMGAVVEMSLEDKLGSDFWYDSSHDENDGENKLHSLEIFYLERGKNASNLKVRFNLPQKDKLTVEKVFDNNFVTDEEKAELYGHDFWFRLTRDGKPFVNENYVVMQNGTIVTENLATLKDGSFSLKYGQKAVFVLETPRQLDHTYQVEEFLKEEQNPPDGAGYWDPNKFITTWETGKNGEFVDEGKTRLADEILVPAKAAYDRTNVDTYSYAFHNYRETYLKDDTVVIDYGKKMNIDIFANDELFTSRAMNFSVTTDPEEADGILNVTDEQSVMYTPTRFMDTIETANYTVKDVHGEDKSATVTVIPATTVYYEDDFPGITFNGGWTTEGDSTTGTDIQDDGTVGAGNNYGYDSTYDGDSLYSAGGAHVINGTGMDTNASFTFKGTGFDIISRTDNETGKIRVAVTHKVDGKDTQVYAKILDTVYKTEGETLYQIPVIRKTGLEYDEYTVTITVLGNAGTEENPSNTKFYLDAIRIYEPLGTENETANKAYEEDNEKTPQIQELRNMLIDQDSFDPNGDFDGVVYIDGSEKVYDIGYYKDYGPNNEVYLKGNYQEADEEGILGGDSIVTTLTTTDGKAPKTIQIGAKAPNGTAKVQVILCKDEFPGYDPEWGWDQEGDPWIHSQVITLDTATDMYYDFKDIFVDEPLDSEYYPWASPTVDLSEFDWKNGVTIIIMNVSEDPSIVSLTNLKTTGAEVSCTVKPEMVYALLDVMNHVTETLTINRAVVDKHSANAEITVNTTSDIVKLNFTENGKTVKTKKITSKVEEDGTITWNVILNLPGKAMSHEIDVFAEDAEGNQSETVPVIVNVKKGGK